MRMSRTTGKPISDLEHLRQSITDILTTPLGSRVMRPKYGSRLFQLTDLPINPTMLVEYVMATAEAIRRWEKRLLVSRVLVDTLSPGKVTIGVVGIYTPTGQELRLDGVAVV